MNQKRMNKKPDDELVRKEIAELTRIKPLVRPLSLFNDDNTASIQAQIDVLSDQRLQNEDAIYDRYQPRNEGGEADDNGNRAQLDSALDALRWLDGEADDETPSESWRPVLARTETTTKTADTLRQ